MLAETLQDRMELGFFHIFWQDVPLWGPMALCEVLDFEDYLRRGVISQTVDGAVELSLVILKPIVKSAHCSQNPDGCGKIKG